MKVLLIDQYSELGGAQRGLIEAALGIVARGGEVLAALPAGPAFDELSHIAGKIEALPCGPFRAERKGAADLARFAAQIPRQVLAIAKLVREADLVYVHGPRMMPAAALANDSRPMVYHAHSIVAQRSAASILAKSLRRVAAVFAVSEFVARWLRQWKIQPRILRNGVSGFPGGPRVRREFTTTGILGRVSPEKGQLTFVRAARIASRQNPNLKFIVAGGPMFGARDYGDMVAKEAGPEVRFLPWNDDTTSFFDQIDMLAVPSTSTDAGPRVILEGFAAGVPVLATNAGGMPEMIQHETTGILVDGLEPADWARAIEGASARPALLAQIAVDAHRAWRERFTLARYQSEVCEALEDVLRFRNVGTSARK